MLLGIPGEWSTVLETLTRVPNPSGITHPQPEFEPTTYIIFLGTAIPSTGMQVPAKSIIGGTRHVPSGALKRHKWLGYQRRGLHSSGLFQTVFGSKCGDFVQGNALLLGRLIPLGDGTPTINGQEGHDEPEINKCEVHERGGLKRRSTRRTRKGTGECDALSAGAPW